MECPICLEPIVDRDGITLNCCAQRLHAQCYVRCLPTCPLCRAKHDVRIEVSEAPDPVPDPVPAPSCARCISAFSTLVMVGLLTVMAITNFQKCS